MGMKLVEASGAYRIEANGETPQTVRLNCCSSCPVDGCTQMLDEKKHARIAMPRVGGQEAILQRILYVSENAKCLKG